MCRIEAEEHVDLEEKFQISADVSFESDQEDFDGLKKLEILEIKKKATEKKIKVEKIELHRSKHHGLF